MYLTEVTIPKDILYKETIILINESTIENDEKNKIKEKINNLLKKNENSFSKLDKDQRIKLKQETNKVARKVKTIIKNKTEKSIGKLSALDKIFESYFSFINNLVSKVDDRGIKGKIIKTLIKSSYYILIPSVINEICIHVFGLAFTSIVIAPIVEELFRFFSKKYSNDKTFTNSIVIGEFLNALGINTFALIKNPSKALFSIIKMRIPASILHFSNDFIQQKTIENEKDENKQKLALAASIVIHSLFNTVANLI